ncbi:YybH family protein [uncultured Friedmanniella sp.]|uniref:YybH family protein n=1 Tax=uncultured Friedmanniella sp. TaxID=335381 RepID=UPI0035C95384
MNQPAASGVITAPDQIHDLFLKATNAHDVATLVAMYDSGGIAVQLDGAECTGAEAMHAMMVGLTDAIRRIDGSTRKLFVTDDIALSSASWTAEMVLPDGTVVRQQGTTAEVSRRQPDGTWKLVIDDPMFA